MKKQFKLNSIPFSLMIISLFFLMGIDVSYAAGIMPVTNNVGFSFFIWIITIFFSENFMQNLTLRGLQKPTEKASSDTLRSWNDFFQANPWFENVFKDDIDALVKEYARKGEKLTPGHIFMAGISKKQQSESSSLETVRHLDLSSN